jgi:FdhD protein
MEDVGRHNAMDKLIGHHLLRENIPIEDGLIVVSGRASWEIMQKALAAGISTVVAMGAPSSLAIELALEFGLTLIGFAGREDFNIYAGPERITHRRTT